MYTVYVDKCAKLEDNVDKKKSKLKFYKTQLLGLTV
jgi:hypothetical protein